LKFKLFLFIILGFFIFNNLTYSHAQLREVDWDGDELADTGQRDNKDSLKAERERIADSIRDERERKTDSTNIARQHKTDSLNAKRKHLADSSAATRKYRDSKHFKDSVSHNRTAKAQALKASRQAHTDSLKDAKKHASGGPGKKSGTDSATAIRKYHDSKHYKDSVERARLAKTNSVKKARQARMDSLKDARARSTDSLTTARKSKTDSIKSAQKKRTDSLAAKKKYKTSKRYADSVALVKHDRADSISDAREAAREKLAAARKHSLDSSKAVRKKSMDSLKTVRTKHLDSVKLVRKAHADSLAKVKKNKEAVAKAKEKNKLDASKLKLEIKMKQKHEAWSNKSMLKKRWSPFRRLMQNSFTHYNYYYNANRKMDEALLNMQRSRKENYDSLIGLYPFDPNRDSTLLAADMDSIVRKVSVAIQIHDPRVKWSNDLYLLLGEAYYYKGSYENASIAFRYIISADEEAKKKKAGTGSGGSGGSKGGPSILEEEKTSRLDFLKHKSVHNEAVLWLARTYTEAHQVENAESVLSLLESDPKFPDDLKGRLAIEKAFAYLTENNQVEASKQLSLAADDNNLPNWLRLRAAFLNGQILQNQGQYNDAANSFEQVISYYPKIDMDFYSRKYIAYNRLMAGEDIADASKPLKNILNDGKYLSYYDQVYYVLGQLASKANKPDEAIGYYTKSVTTPRATKKQKAISYAAMGDVFYASARYPNAKMAYDSAAKYASSAGKDKGVTASVQRVKGLEEISGPTRVIYEQDSLMALSALSKKEQQAAVRRYLRYLEQHKEDSIRNAEAMSLSAPTPAEADEASKTESSWYFGSPTLMSQGSDDFKRKWGTRPLTDNWRRAAAISLTGSGSEGGEEEAAVESDQETGLPTEASLLARIPNSPSQKELSVKLEQRAYILLAKAYVKQLEDYVMANNTLDTLDAKFPNHNQKEEELYLRYQIALKQNKLDKAQTYSQELLAKFPQSQYANMLRPKHSESQGDSTSVKVVAAYFDQTYSLLMQHQYTEALMRINIAKKQYDDPLYNKRFEVAEAMGNAGMGEYDKADTVISHFLRTYPSDTLTPWAASVKEYIKQVRNGGKPAWYNDTLPTPKSGALAKKDVAPVVPKVVPPPGPPTPPIPAQYSYHPQSPHYCIVVLPGLESRTSVLKHAIKKFNSTTDSTSNLNMLFDLYNIDLGVMVIKQFINATQAKNYMDAMMASPALSDYKPSELNVFIISEENYRKLFADKKPQPYATFYNASYR
jgi:tetratricopeptide (TPR) repeat protein